MTKLKEAVADITEMFREVATISHPYTDSHVLELERRCHRIGAGLSGEDRTRFDAVLRLGLVAVAEVQRRNATDTIEVVDGAFVTTAADAPLSGQPRWEEKLESLEFALSSFGLSSNRHGDDAIVVEPIKATAKTYTYGLTPKDVITKSLPAAYSARFGASDAALIYRIGKKVAELRDIQSGEHVKLTRASVEILLELLLESDEDDAMNLRSAILDSIGIEEV